MSNSPHKCKICKNIINTWKAKMCWKCLIKKRNKSRSGFIFKCNNCGKKSYQRKSQYSPNKTHFCSKICSSLWFNHNKSIGKKIKIYKDYIKYKKFLNSINSNQIAWLTGFWEGEGYIKKFNKISIRFSLSQKDKPPIIYIKRFLKIGNISYNKIYTFSIYKTGYSLALIEKMLPFINSIKRKKEIKEVLKLKKRIYD
jgi:hypothetical protein